MKEISESTVKMTVNLAHLMIDAANEMNSFAVAHGFRIANGCLVRIAERAIELNDKDLLDELETIGYITFNK